MYILLNYKRIFKMLLSKFIGTNVPVLTDSVKQATKDAKNPITID